MGRGMRVFLVEDSKGSLWEREGNDVDVRNERVDDVSEYCSNVDDEDEGEEAGGGCRAVSWRRGWLLLLPPPTFSRGEPAPFLPSLPKNPLSHASQTPQPSKTFTHPPTSRAIGMVRAPFLPSTITLISPSADHRRAFSPIYRCVSHRDRA